jgi:hypothetical protein
MEEQLTSIIKTLNDLKSTQNKLITSINDQGKTLKSFTKRFDDLTSQINKLSAENTALNTKVSNLENKIIEIEKNSTSNSQISEIDLINELVERQSRAQNIILFNLPENSNNTHNQTSDEDRIKLIFTEMGINFNPIKFFRLGKPSTRPRPIKITLLDTTSVFEVLRAQSKLRLSTDFKDLRFSSDRTIKQREIMSSLRKQLESRRNNGETNIIIKYIKGNPVIVSSKN